MQYLEELLWDGLNCHSLVCWLLLKSSRYQIAATEQRAEKLLITNCPSVVSSELQLRFSQWC